jgi:hypothetical protein
MERDTGKPLRIDFETLRQYILKGEYKIIQTSVAYNLGHMFNSVFTVAEELQHFGYEVLHAPREKVFVTSDSPVFTLEPDPNGQASIGVGFRSPRVEVFFPLNKRACLKLKRGVGRAIREIGERLLHQINCVTMVNATQYLYSSEGQRRISRLFDQWGCKIKPGTNAFMPTSETPKS